MKLTIKAIEAEVFAEKESIYYVKISLLELGMYISGITVRLSPKYSGWWVQMPYYWNTRSGATKRYVEYSKQSVIKPIIEQECIAAVEHYQAKEEAALERRQSSSIDVDNQSTAINLSDIPF